ncbi:Ent-kaurene oxidase [Mycena sanguinolenta]|uniref:Ent-kaurene oxidase n=1 Tax=Mycena sanguinolenta TaxID=230812 RepID=A0A8H6ZC59_9AGAR|nr:Ent-kaurene oxidase [Mycena sanguinolenta]
MEPVYFSLFAFIFTAFLVFVLATRKTARSLPGPRGLPFIGSIHELPKENVWKVYSDWAAKYGEIFAFNVFNRQIVVINSISIATELMDKRARLYSDRPDLALLPLLGWGFDLAFMRIHDPRYRPHRKIVAQQFSRRIQKFEEVQLAECRRTLLAILHNPADFFPLVKHFAASVILKTTYGQELGQNKHLVHLATEAVDVLSEKVFFGAQLLYAFPLLRHLPWWAPVPGAGIKRFARSNTATVSEMVDLPIESLQKSLNAGGDIPCWATNLLQENSATSITDIKAVTATSYAAGIHTVESPMKSFLLAMILYPRCQELAQAEIDRVIGLGRLPSFEDRSQLPYVSAICREILRWHPPVPLGVAHAISEDDIYDGCFIPKVLQQGYEQYRNGAFKIPQMDRWIVLVSGNEMLDALRGAPEHILSMEAAMTDLLSADYTLGTETLRDTYHLGVIKHAMNKQLGSVVPAIADETKKAFDEIIGKRVEKDPTQWTSIRVNEAITDIVCRAVNRAFVGAALCRNEDYLEINKLFTKHVIFGAVFINFFPGPLKNVAGAAFTRISGLRKRMAQHIGPLIKARSKDSDRKNDMLTWLMEAAPAHEANSADALALRILNVNFMALHSTAMTFIHALLHLASKPEYLQPLRQELEEQFGYSLNITFELETFDKCWKLDSFLKESQRLNGLGAFSMPRKALVPFQFPDGTIVPAGAIVGTIPPAIHMDERHYKNADTFDGFRFVSQRVSANGGQSDANLRLTGLGNTYLSFGGGRHAW